MKKRHLLLLLTLVLAGCGIGTPPAMTPYPPPTTTGPSPSTSPESPVPSSSGLPRPSFSAGKAQAEITVVGVVEAGVEKGCIILRSGEAMWQLVGSSDPLIQLGARISVTGRTNPDLVTTCQQGTPLQVSVVRTA